MTLIDCSKIANIEVRVVIHGGISLNSNTWAMLTLEQQLVVLK
jgi:hypothetical protein